jgi:hypothetical protein
VKKANEKQWAAVCRITGRVCVSSYDKGSVGIQVDRWPLALRLARVQITEIEEESDDKG